MEGCAPQGITWADRPARVGGPTSDEPPPVREPRRLARDRAGGPLRQRRSHSGHPWRGLCGAKRPCSCMRLSGTRNGGRPACRMRAPGGPTWRSAAPPNQNATLPFATARAAPRRGRRLHPDVDMTSAVKCLDELASTLLSVLGILLRRGLLEDPHLGPHVRDARSRGVSVRARRRATTDPPQGTSGHSLSAQGSGSGGASIPDGGSC